jgi:hypothetical protein
MCADVALGVPDYVGHASGAKSFLRWLERGWDTPDFFEPVDRADDWAPLRPFWRNPHGRGSQTSFFDDIRARYADFPPDHRLRRKIDHWVAGKPPTCVAGMPGTVGAGTRAFWSELATSKDAVIWPFANPDLCALLAGGERPILVEAYPALCYGIVFAETLPAEYVFVAKSVRDRRSEALVRLKGALAWAPGLRIADGLWDAALECEDDFDALFMGLALYRMAVDGRLVSDPGASGPQPDPAFEGSIVGSWCVTEVQRRAARRSRPVGPPSARRAPESLMCPIAGCRKVFKLGRCGWDSHVASLRNHPGWYPGVHDGGARKDLFRSVFATFFRARR